MHLAAINYARHVYGHRILGNMTQLIAKGKLRDSILMLLVYMRWLDDIADESDMDHGQKKKLLEKSLAFMERSKHEDLDFVALCDLRVEERCAYFFIKDATEALNERGASQHTLDNVIGGAIDMISGILQDLHNMNHIMDEKEFYEKSYYIRAGVGFKTTAYILYNNPKPEVVEAFKYFGYIWQMNNDTPDVAKDLRCGLINMTRQEVEKAGIKLEDWKGREDKLVKYLEMRTDFFKDRTAKLQEWKKIVEKGLPHMDPWTRFIAKNAIKMGCPEETFDSSSARYKVIKAQDYASRNARPGTERSQHILNLLPIFIPDKFVLALYNLYFKRAILG